MKILHFWWYLITWGLWTLNVFEQCSSNEMSILCRDGRYISVYFTNISLFRYLGCWPFQQLQEDFIPWAYKQGRCSELAIERYFGRLRSRQANAQLSPQQFWQCSQREMQHNSARHAKFQKTSKVQKEPALTEKQFLSSTIWFFIWSDCLCLFCTMPRNCTYFVYHVSSCFIMLYYALFVYMFFTYFLVYPFIYPFTSFYHLYIYYNLFMEIYWCI